MRANIGEGGRGGVNCRLSYTIHTSREPDFKLLGLFTLSPRLSHMRRQNLIIHSCRVLSGKKYTLFYLANASFMPSSKISNGIL